jgi:hypothetical protein
MDTADDPPPLLPCPDHAICVDVVSRLPGMIHDQISRQPSPVATQHDARISRHTRPSLTPADPRQPSFAKASRCPVSFRDRWTEGDCGLTDAVQLCSDRVREIGNKDRDLVPVLFRQTSEDGGKRSLLTMT